MIKRIKNWLRFLAHTTRRNPFRGGWLPMYLRQQRQSAGNRSAESTIDVMVCIVDHFEPGEQRGDTVAGERVRDWCQRYADMVSSHRDSDGVAPQHTWFYRFEYLNRKCMVPLSEFSFRGFGEVEFHLHHGFDTHETFCVKLSAGLDLGNQYGAMLTAESEPQRKFGYIAGNWSLDNGSRDPSKSGCNTEIGALRDLGCFADYTFPAIGNRAQPRMVNSLYYANDCPQPKSYDRGTPVSVHGSTGDLMICQGPVFVDWRMPYIETAAIESFALPKASRMNGWLNANVHVAGRPEWKFIKLHTHGTQSVDAWFGGDFERMFTEMEARWNRPPYRLHYVTAREMFNIVKAAEAGCSGNPADYRDFVIPKPANRWFHCDEPWRLVSFNEDLAMIEFLNNDPKTIDFGFSQLNSVSGDITAIKVFLEKGQAVDLQITAVSHARISTCSPLSFEPTCFGFPLEKLHVSLDQSDEFNHSRH